MLPMNKKSLLIDADMAAGLDEIGDRWALLILRDAFLGRSRFEEFIQHTGASRSTLTRRLNTLIEAEVLYKKNYGKRYQYKLTSKGLGLFQASLLSWEWESNWADSNSDQLPPVLFHRQCESNLTPVTVCVHCEKTLRLEDVEWPAIDQNIKQQLGAIQSFNKRRVRTSSAREAQDLSLATVSDLVGDRWTLLLLITAFLGENRYDGFQKALNIASNILTARLNILVDAKIFERELYLKNPPRHEYGLTKKGFDLYPLVMALRQWVLDWLPNSAEVLIHKPCANLLKMEVRCKCCNEIPSAKSVILKN